MRTGVDRLRANMARLLAELEATSSEEGRTDEENAALDDLAMMTTLAAARAAIELDDRVRSLERQTPRHRPDDFRNIEW